jgi:hypothetical protein
MVYRARRALWGCPHLSGAPDVKTTGDYFIFYGILIVIFSMILGLSLAALIERLKIGRWW